MKRTLLIYIFLAAIVLLSCSSDDVESSENFIESFSLPGIESAQIDIINGQSSMISVVVSAADEEKLGEKEPEVEVSKGASLKKTEGKNWTDEGFKYIVTAENDDVREYSISIKTNSVSKINSFEDWSSENNYYVLSDLNWSSGNEGIKWAFPFIKGKNIDNKNPENYPTKKTEDGYRGNAVLLETIEGGYIELLGEDKPLLSGNFFLGRFNFDKALSDELAATEFGKMYFSKPKSVKGYYKYKEGTGETIGNIDKDYCDIYAVFYKAEDETGNEIILTAKDNLENLEANSSVLAYSRLKDCSETEGEDFHEFSLDLSKYKEEPDFENHKYKLAIVFAASYKGAAFIGKIGSKLIVDEVTIEDLE